MSQQSLLLSVQALCFGYITSHVWADGRKTRGRNRVTHWQISPDDPPTIEIRLEFLNSKLYNVVGRKLSDLLTTRCLAWAKDSQCLYFCYCYCCFTCPLSITYCLSHALSGMNVCHTAALLPLYKNLTFLLPLLLEFSNLDNDSRDIDPGNIPVFKYYVHIRHTLLPLKSYLSNPPLETARSRIRANAIKGLILPGFNFPFGTNRYIGRHASSRTINGKFHN